MDERMDTLHRRVDRMRDAALVMEQGGWEDDDAADWWRGYLAALRAVLLVMDDISREREPELAL